MAGNSVINVGGELYPRVVVYYWNPVSLAYELGTQPGGGGGAGDASAANQVTQTARLEAIRDRLPIALSAGGRLLVELPAGGSGLTDAELRATAVPISAASLPLPAGAATSALQTSGNASLTSIDGKLPALMSSAPASDTGQPAIPVRVISQLGAGSGGGGAVTIADGADVAQGAKADTAWDLAAAAPTLVAILKKAATLLDSIRVSLAGTLTITGNVGITGTPQVDVADEDTRLLGRVKVLDSAGLVIDPAKDGTDATGVTMPAGGAGIRGWLSSIYNKLNTSIAVTGPLTDAQLRAAAVPVSNTQLPAALAAGGGLKVEGVAGGVAQPVSATDAVFGATVAPKAASVWDVSDRAARALGVIASITAAVAGTNAASSQADGHSLSIGATGDLASANTVIGRLKALVAQLPATLGQKAMAASMAVVVASDQSAIPVTAPALTKGTQGAQGFTVQQLKDAGRNLVTYYMVIPVLATATDALQSLTGTKGGATVVATTTPAVVTAGKTLRITRMAASYIATATTGYGIVRLRFNTAGVVAIGSPIAATLAVGSGAPVTANAVGMEEATLGDGLEFAAGTGIGVSVQGFAAATAAAVGYVIVSVTGFEY